MPVSFWISVSSPRSSTQILADFLTLREHFGKLQGPQHLPIRTLLQDVAKEFEKK